MPRSARILVLGAGGMLGGYLVPVLVADGHTVTPATRADFDVLHDPWSVVDWRAYDVVINALGVIPQKCREPDVMQQVNGAFPRAAAPRCQRWLQVSTDCVFSGKRGDYSVRDVPDPCDDYGRSKLRGEVGLVVRGSFVGEGGPASLLETVLRQSEMYGYTDHLWNGVSCLKMAELVANLAAGEVRSGLVHVAGAERMSKFDLCRRIAAVYGHELKLRPKRPGASDRTLRPTLATAEPLEIQLARQREFERWEPS